MKYMLMFVQTDGEAWEKLSPAQQHMPAIERWFGEHARAGRLAGGNQLRPARTATTVRWKGSQPVVTDGPFIEGKETIGGYGIFEVPDLDAAIAGAVALLERAAAAGRPGPYQVQAAIVACHAEAPSWEATDWRQILALYDVLARFDPSPVIALNRAIALRHVAGPAAALAAVEALGGPLDRYHLFHATRAELLRALGRAAEAREADVRAVALTSNPAERALLQERAGLH